MPLDEDPAVAAQRESLEEAGVKVEMVSTDAPGWNQRVSNWDFDLTFNFLYQLGDPATIAISAPEFPAPTTSTAPSWNCVGR